ncbi:MAG: sigma-70 family RNA polymerase sigma factor [Bryobacterales bacterium]|nr:sigma-70 family RNA polymerase sigma factor [Bryobacterales bacterium]
MPYEKDTAIGGPSDRFPDTHYSAVEQVASGDPETRRHAFNAILASYWKPAYKYIRRKWNKDNEDAKDLTQGFFLQALDKGYLENFDSSKASFRTYLRTCLDAWVANRNVAAQAVKRGGRVQFTGLDFANAEGELQELPVAGGLNGEEFFHQEWVRHLFSTAVDCLRAEAAESGRLDRFQLFERYDLEQSADSYQQLAEQSGLPVTTITNHLGWARRRFRAIVLEQIRAVSGSRDEFQREARALLGNLPPC